MIWRRVFRIELKTEQRLLVAERPSEDCSLGGGLVPYRRRPAARRRSRFGTTVPRGYKPPDPDR